MFGILNRFLPIAGVAMVTNGFLVHSLAAESIELKTLCLKFPLNSRCRNYQDDLEVAKPNINRYQLDRQTFCQEFPLNSLCLSDPVEIINFNLDEEEWIRIQKSGNRIQLSHADRTANSLVSLITDGAKSLVPSPGLLDLLPFNWFKILPLDLNKYDWQDHLVTGVSFKTDRCQADACLITGKNAIDLPKDTSFSQGVFTVEYQERDLQRSVTFRIPDDVEVLPIATFTISVPDGTFE